MKACNTTDLYNKYVQEQASEAFHTVCISDETYKNILVAHRYEIYTPNYFIRIGLAVLTIVAILFFALLVGLLFNISGSGSLFFFLFFLALICYTTLELLVKQKHYYNAGVDNILMLATVIFIVSAFFIEDYSDQFLIITVIVVIICLWLSIRFTDAFMAMISYTALFAFVFLLYIKLGNIAQITAPFVMMTVSVIIYFTARKFYSKEKLLFYRFSFKAVILLSLISFYASGNYFIVKELSNEMFNLQLQLNDPITFGWFFWIFTVVIPPAYIVYGIQKRDFIFLRTGLLLLAVTIFTVRYYHAVIPVELAMLIAGLILIIVSYVLIRYLKTPKHGFTFANTGFVSREILNAEALIIVQTFGKKATVDNHIKFGGGSSGGGGATGNY
jgi:hypothetical protein